MFSLIMSFFQNVGVLELGKIILSFIKREDIISIIYALGLNIFN